MKTRAGFTLIELLVTVAILGILAAIAWPRLLDYVVKARRAQAQAALLENLQLQERYFTQHNTYLAFGGDGAQGDARRFKWYTGNTASASAHELRGQACTGYPITRCIELQALPGTGRVDPGFRDTECQTLTLTSLGEQRASGPGKRCWP